MSRLATLGVGLLVAAIGLAGCGGGGGGTGVSPVSPPSPASTQQVFVLDFVHRTVTTAVQPQYVERNPGQSTAALALTLSIALTDTGNPGLQQVIAKVKNNSNGPVGMNDQGTVTGIDLCFVNTVFEKGSTPVSGGSYWGYTSFDPATHTPVYNIPQSLTIGTTSQSALIDLTLPPTATTAVVTVVVRADTTRGYPPDLTRWYLTALAGRNGTSGYADGPAGRALFNGVQCSVYRDELGDLLVSDYLNNCIRLLSPGQVSTFAAGGLGSPVGVGRDPAGNVYISNLSGDCVSLVRGLGGKPTVIAGLFGTPADVSSAPGGTARFNNPGGLAVNGNLVYLCDSGNKKMKLLTFSGPSDAGNLFAPSSWFVTDITHGAAFGNPTGVAVDGFGNVFVADDSNNKVYVLPLGGGAWAAIAGSGARTETDGTGLTATFAGPHGIAVDQAGYVYVADLLGSLRRLRLTGGSPTVWTNWVVETLVPSAAAPVEGFTGTGRVANLRGVSCARDGTLYLTEGNDVRRLDRTRN